MKTTMWCLAACFCGTVFAEEENVQAPAPEPQRQPSGKYVMVPAIEPGAMLQPRRFPVQILTATYGTKGKDADVTARVREFVEQQRQKFSANPKDLGVDPVPHWNKGLHIIYMKDGVRREQRRGENETILPESFYGPQDANELKAWLIASRWYGEKPDIQFHADLTFTSPGSKEAGRWKATAARTIRLSWPKEEEKEFGFNFTWSSFAESGNAKNVYYLMK